MDYGNRKEHFHICFPFHASITIGMGVIFLITNRGQISKLYFKQKLEF